MTNSTNLRSALIVGLSCVVIAAAMPMAAQSQQDIGLDFSFVRIGDTRNQVIQRLGPPNAETKSKSFFVIYRKLFWTAEGKKVSISFIADRVWRWKKCDLSISDC